MSNREFRTEKDFLGEVKVPSNAYYGVQTVRAVQNFPISGLKLPREFIRAQGIIKLSAAKANMSVGRLDRRIGEAIVKAAQEVIEGKLDSSFVVDVFQAGAGTSQNMNANEVIANRSIEILGGKLGDYKLVHPNDHVNMAQSTNDTIHVAIHIASKLCFRAEFGIDTISIHSQDIKKVEEFHKYLPLKEQIIEHLKSNGMQSEQEIAQAINSNVHTAHARLYEMAKRKIVIYSRDSKKWGLSANIR